jgi:phage terminase small subunit
MTDQQRLFADQYLILNNGTKAAIAAGYSEKSARSQASQLLVLEEIENYIEERRQEASKISLVDVAWVQTRFKEISDRCMTAEPVMEWVDGEQVPSGEYKFDSSGANKATENLGKIIGAYTKDNEQKKSDATVTIFELPDNGRK